MQSTIDKGKRAREARVREAVGWPAESSVTPVLMTVLRGAQSSSQSSCGPRAPLPFCAPAASNAKASNGSLSSCIGASVGRFSRPNESAPRAAFSSASSTSTVRRRACWPDLRGMLMCRRAPLLTFLYSEFCVPVGSSSFRLHAHASRSSR